MENERMGKVFHVKRKEKQVDLDIIASNTDLNTKTLMRDKEGYYIMDQSNKICDYSKCILTQCEGAWLFRTTANESKGRHKPKTVTIGNINTPLSPINRINII